MNALVSHLFEISKSIQHGEYTVPDLGHILPASLMMHDLVDLKPVACSYMNNWGTNYLGTCPEEIVEMGTTYYDKFFIKEEIDNFTNGLIHFIVAGDYDKTYSFFQRVHNYSTQTFVWCLTTCKLLEFSNDNKLIVLSTPVDGMDFLMQRVNKTLHVNEYLKDNYKKYALLTNREKEIIKMLTHGLSTMEISDQLYISSHTVATHRKNISKKIACKSFAELLKFAINFELT